MKNSECEQDRAALDDQSKPLRQAINELRSNRSISPLEGIWKIKK